MIEAGDQATSLGASVLTLAADRHPLGRLSLAPRDFVRMALATVLLTAAALKAHQLATEPVAETSLFASRWFLIALVEFELAFGLWLLAGLYSRMTWAAAVTCFGAFGAVALYRAVSGEGSCGCFGRVELSPWWAFILDAGAVLALLTWPPRFSRVDQIGSAGSSRARWRLVWVLSTAFMVGLPAGVAMARYSPASLAKDGVIFDDGGIVLLEPDDWVGKLFPLLPYIDCDAVLEEGRWLVVLYQHDCPHCKEVLANLDKHPQGLDDPSGQVSRLALIEMPPYGGEMAPVQLPRDASVAYGQLSSGPDWFAQTPLLLLLDNGHVKNSLGRKE